MKELTLVLVKPDGIEFLDRILSELDSLGKRIATMTVPSVPREVIQDHYSVHRGKSFFGYMTEYFVGKEVVLAVYEGDDVVRRVIDACGNTDPSTASPDSIRGRYSDDSLETAITEGRPLRNVVHRSESVEEAMREIGVWGQYLERE